MYPEPHHFLLQCGYSVAFKKKCDWQIPHVLCPASKTNILWFHKLEFMMVILSLKDFAQDINMTFYISRANIIS